MAQRKYFPKLISITIGFFLSSFSSIAGLPIFEFFTNKKLLQVTGLLSTLPSIGFLCYQLYCAEIRTNHYQIRWCRPRTSIFEAIFKLLKQWIFGASTEVSERNSLLPSTGSVALEASAARRKSPHLIAYLFFLGYATTLIYRMVNWLYWIQHDCATYLGFAFLISLLLFSCLLMATIATESDYETTPGNCVSFIGWSTIAGCSFNLAFRYVLGITVATYVLYYEHNSVDPSPSSGIGVVVDQIQRCRTKSLLPGVNDIITEINATFGVEFYSLSTFYAVLRWMKLDKSTSEMETCSCSNVNPVELDHDERHQCDMSCYFSIPAKSAIAWIGSLSLFTFAAVVYFFKLMNANEYFDGIRITHFQDIVLQGSVFWLEIVYYRNHLSKMDNNSTLPPKHQLDLNLLLFPLLPYAINFALVGLPNILDLFLTSQTSYFMIVVKIIYNIFQYSQVAFQTVFVAELLCTKNKQTAFGQCKYFFLVLAALNFCIWVSSTLQCPLKTMYGMYSTNDIYGISGTILIVYGTLPFVLFNFAHVTTVFLEVYFELKM